MRARWVIVFTVAASLIVVPLAFQGRTPAESSLSATELGARVQSSGHRAWSGFVQSSGGLQVPDTDSFANLAQLLGENNELRVWWRSPSDWRVDRIRSTGETDLFRSGDTAVRWVFESETATVTPTSTVRLPDASDLLPPTLGRTVLQGAHDAELSRLPARRVAGISAPGLRLLPDDQGSTVARADLWIDPDTGLALRVELYAAGNQQPVLTTALRHFDRDTPDPALTRFRPAAGVEVNFDQSVDVAAAANAFAPYDLPPSLGGLPSRAATDPGAVGVYGRGPTTLIVLPLRRQVAEPLRSRLRESAAVREITAGTLLPVGLVSVLVTRRGFATQGGEGSGTFLLTGTVDQPTLERAAADLGASG